MQINKIKTLSAPTPFYPDHLPQHKTLECFLMTKYSFFW